MSRNQASLQVKEQSLMCYIFYFSLFPLVLFALVVAAGCSNTVGKSGSMGNCISGNCYDGHGTWIYPDGGRYVGNWRKGKRNGQGTDYFSNGDIYEGNFVDEARSGYGKMTSADGKIYIGQWKDDLKHGKGREEHPNGFTFEGNYLNDNAVQGKRTWPDGSRYTGSWINGKVHGKGVYTNTSGEQWDQVYENGEQISSIKREKGYRARNNNNSQPEVVTPVPSKTELPSGKRWKKVD